MMRLFRRPSRIPPTRRFERETFEHFRDYSSGRVFEDLEFRRCHFLWCRISETNNPRRRSVVRNIRFIDCEEGACIVFTPILEDVLIDGFRTSARGPFQTSGAAFKHVTLRGKIGQVMTSPLVPPGLIHIVKEVLFGLDPYPKYQRAFDAANAAYYETVDWALDITEAEFQEADIRGVPARLIRRDPATQVVVTRQKALEGRWRNLDLSGTHWATSIQFLIDGRDEDVVLVAPKRHRNYRKLLDGLKMLRDAGVAEPD